MCSFEKKRENGNSTNNKNMYNVAHEHMYVFKRELNVNM